MTDQLVIIMCPNVYRYPIAPADQPGCEMISCPHCSRKMWISAKKRVLRDSGVNAYIACYDCLEHKSRFDPEFFRDHTMIRL